MPGPYQVGLEEDDDSGILTYDQIIADSVAPAPAPETYYPEEQLVPNSGPVYYEEATGQTSYDAPAPEPSAAGYFDMQQYEQNTTDVQPDYTAVTQGEEAAAQTTADWFNQLLEDTV